MARVNGVEMDFVYNGQVHGDVAQRLESVDWDPGALRPWRGDGRIGHKGRNYVTLNRDGKPRTFMTNAPSSLTYLGYQQIDRRLIEVALPRLRVRNDIVNEGLTYDLPDGLGTPILLEQSISDFGTATISMNALKRSERDTPTLDTRLFPIPIIHGEFSFDSRFMRIANKAGLPMDLRSAATVTRRITEVVESLFLGTAPTYSYGGGTIYGLTNKPERITKVLTLPTASGWTPRTFVDEVNDMCVSLDDINFPGPYGMYYSKGWSPYFGQDYSDVYQGTLRTRLQELMGEDADIQWMRKVRYGLTDFQIVIFQLTEDVIQALNGLDLTTLQWDAMGGLARNWKIMCIYLPMMHHNANGQTGVCHGTAA